MASVKGINETIKELRKFGKDAIELINAETEDAANDISGNAKKLAPKNFGKLAQSISVAQDVKSRGQIWGVFVNAPYGAYVEFGTGAKFKPIADKEFSDIAATFKGKRPGTFEKGIRAIEEWLKAKGGDPKDAKWILLRIIGAGLEPRPFLYPAYIQGKKKYLDNLTKILKSFNKKI